eukprot:1159764-Pelagomonas_calceolata.AAC.5
MICQLLASSLHWFKSSGVWGMLLLETGAIRWQQSFKYFSNSLAGGVWAEGLLLLSSTNFWGLQSLSTNHIRGTNRLGNIHLATFCFTQARITLGPPTQILGKRAGGSY